MRKRKRMSTGRAVLAVATAAVLGGLAAPAAQADGWGDTVITKVAVGNVAVGTTQAKTFQVSVTASDDSGIKGADMYLEGPSYGYLQPTGAVRCVESSADATTSTCTGTFTVDPRVDFIDNSPAGTWYVNAWIDANDDDYVNADKAGSFAMQRYSKLTVNASPEPVTKGKTVTVTGVLTRANWETGSYAGYTVQPVKLEFRKKSSDTYTAVKTVKSGSGGALKATVTATQDGWFRWNFAGTSTTPPVKASGDYVDVR
ncbi:calcium-binding protein [Streptomyces sp. NPDC005322]|uniref:calcium-binding protein n=1 Tax=Streptomyces sp. NPDC005322 TaxID=3157032 RepID=UPI0033B3E596